MPRTVADLAAHRHVRYRLAGQVVPIAFADGARVPLEGAFDSDSGEALRTAAVNRLGIAQILRTAVQADLDANRLRVVLPDVGPAARAAAGAARLRAAPARPGEGVHRLRGGGAQAIRLGDRAGSGLKSVRQFSACARIASVMKSINTRMRVGGCCRLR